MSPTKPAADKIDRLKSIQPIAILLAELISILIYERIEMISRPREWKKKKNIEIIFNKRPDSQSQTHSAIIFFLLLSNSIIVLRRIEWLNFTLFYLIYGVRIVCSPESICTTERKTLNTRANRMMGKDMGKERIDDSY